MSDILEISNWYQLTKARADNSNLRIVVECCNVPDDNKSGTEELVGTKIQIVNYKSNDVYLTLFGSIKSSDIIPVEASLEPEMVVNIINRYGFNVRISPPEVLQENVITILSGLYASGYRYVYKDYPNKGEDGVYVVYASKQIEKRMTGFDITSIPDFVPDEWDWCKPWCTYPIEDLIETGTNNNGLPID